MELYFQFSKADLYKEVKKLKKKINLKKISQMSKKRLILTLQEHNVLMPMMPLNSNDKTHENIIKDYKFLISKKWDKMNIIQKRNLVMPFINLYKINEPFYTNEDLKTILRLIYKKLLVDNNSNLLIEFYDNI